MGRRLEESVREERREWVQRQASSGMSAARFCQKHGLKVTNFHAWKRRLNEKTAGEWPRNGNEEHESGDRPIGFLELPMPSVASAPRDSSWIEVSSAAGIVVRVPSGNLPALRTVLGALNDMPPGETPTATAVARAGTRFRLGEIEYLLRLRVKQPDLRPADSLR